MKQKQQTLIEYFGSIIMGHSSSNCIKIFAFTLILFGSLTVYGQSRFTIIVTGQKMHNGDTLYLSYKENGKHILETATASNKKFTFTGLVKHPIKASIYRNENPERVEFITESVNVYLEPGKIEINSPDTLTGAVISGTALNDTLQLFENQRADLKERMRTIKDPDFFTEEEKQDTALVNHNKSEIEKIFYEGADTRLAFAEKYPNSYVSLDLLYDLSRINTYIFKVEEVYSNLAEHLKQTEHGNTISERIKKKRQVMTGVKAIDFTLKDPNGKTINLSSFKGKYILLDFWASWPCREEHPNLITAYENYKNKDFTILSVSIDTEKEKWIKAIEKDKITWTQVSDLKGKEGEVYLNYGITSIPANFLIDPNGIVIAKDLKEDALKNRLAEIFSKN